MLEDLIKFEMKNKTANKTSLGSVDWVNKSKNNIRVLEIIIKERTYMLEVKTKGEKEVNKHTENLLTLN